MKRFFSHPLVSLTLKIAVSISILAALFYYINIDEILQSISRADTLLLVLGCSLVIANTGIHFIRWRYLLRLLSKDISNEEVFTSLLVGFAAGFFTPAQVGEIAGRIVSHPELRKSHVVGMTIIDKLYILALTILTGVAALTLFAALYFTEYWNMLYTIPVIVICGFLIFAFLFPQSIKSMLRFVPEKIRDHNLYNMISIIETKFYNAQGRTLFALTLLLYVVIAVQFFIFINAFETVSFFDTALCSLSVYFVKAVVLPISIGDLGVRESASIFFFSKVGVSAVAAFNASMCMFLANVLLPSAVGALMILKLKLKW
ncbi:MAG: flippase-like domain-containing protein [Ignavibacteriales bacterium]|nr:flippase-like domain-containing protein [Ignavibacteriales bacterium]